jgi:hypothetical protein
MEKSCRPAYESAGVSSKRGEKVQEQMEKKANIELKADLITENHNFNKINRGIINENEK